jgi:hypothetical protein
MRQFYENIRFVNRSHLVAYQNDGNTSQQTSARHHHSFVFSWMTFCDTAMTTENERKRLPLNENTMDINTSTRKWYTIEMLAAMPCMYCHNGRVYFRKRPEQYCIFVFSKPYYVQSFFNLQMYILSYHLVSIKLYCQPYCKTSIRIIHHVSNKVKLFPEVCSSV